MTVLRHFGENTLVWLFGSRVDDRRKGGDYDFYFETELVDPDEILDRKLALLADLHSTAEFEDEKIDLVIRPGAPGQDLPIFHIAKADGIRL
ncbi:MAG: nucleotidyltransferase domain-containing protein [Methylococcaceae bacterium]|nr:nucleotidyltransferase domain-containing protein [Methylococcaceae bacterium]